MLKTSIARHSSLPIPTLPNRVDCGETRVAAKLIQSLNSQVLYYNSIHAPYTFHRAATQCHVPWPAQALPILSCLNCYSSSCQLNTPFPCPIHFSRASAVLLDSRLQLGPWFLHLHRTSVFTCAGPPAASWSDVASGSPPSSKSREGLQVSECVKWTSSCLF